MNLLFSGNKKRCISCLRAVQKSHNILGVIGHKKDRKANHFIDEAKRIH